MTKAELKIEIEKTAKDTDCTELEIITAMQSYCAKNGDEYTLSILIDLKHDYIIF